MFVFISGFLFQHLLYKFEFRRFLITRFLLVALPYLIVSVPAVVVWTFVLENASLGIPADFYEQPPWFRIVYFYATGVHLAPVWFIPMICLFYLASPVFAWFDRHPKLYYALPFFFFLSYLVPRHWNPVIAGVHFLSVYLFGMFCSRHRERLISLAYPAWPVLLVVFVLLVACELTLTRGVQTYFNYWNKMVVSVLLIAVLARNEVRIGARIEPLAEINFSIFFLHAYVLAAVKILWVGRPSVPLPLEGAVLTHLVLVGCIVGLCVALILPLRAVLSRYSRYVIGS